jgi:hypothetical protein
MRRKKVPHNALLRWGMAYSRSRKVASGRFMRTEV